MAIDPVLQYFLAAGPTDRALVWALACPPMAFCIMGMMIVMRRRENRIGWLSSGTGLVFAVGVLTTHLSQYGFEHQHVRGDLVLVSAVIADATWGVLLLLLAPMLILFPTGHPSSRS